MACARVLDITKDHVIMILVIKEELKQCKYSYYIISN